MAGGLQLPQGIPCLVRVPGYQSLHVQALLSVLGPLASLAHDGVLPASSWGGGRPLVCLVPRCATQAPPAVAHSYARDCSAACVTCGGWAFAWLLPTMRMHGGALRRP